MLITFFIFRVLLFPYLYYAYGRYVSFSFLRPRRGSERLASRSVTPPPSVCRYASIPFHMVPLSVPWHCNLGAALLMAPQLYWFSLICRGALRLFRGTSRSQRPTPPGDKELQTTHGNTLPQPANGYNARSSEPELATH